eukprot:8268619-Pyramimonas_sp.AAC.1
MARCETSSSALQGRAFECRVCESECALHCARVAHLRGVATSQPLHGLTTLRLRARLPARALMRGWCASLARLQRPR